MSDERFDEEDDQFVRDHLTSAGPRPTLPEGELERIKAAARPVWKQRYCRPEVSPWRRWTLPTAAVLALCALVLWTRDEPAPRVLAPVSTASVDRVRGAVFVSDSDGRNRRPVTRGSTLTVGSILETSLDVALASDVAPASAGEGAAVSLRLIGGQSLRLEPGTRVRFSALLQVALDRGAVYFDSLNATPAKPASILTSAGVFQPSGTQFEVRTTGGSVELRVREGIVQFVRGSEVAETQAGEKLTIRSDGAVEIAPEPSYGERWQWVLETAPMLDIEGRPLRAFLSWIAREQGLKLEYENERAAALGSTTILHGSIASLTPQESLQTISMSSGFQYRVNDGTLFVSFEDDEKLPR